MRTLSLRDAVSAEFYLKTFPAKNQHYPASPVHIYAYSSVRNEQDGRTLSRAMNELEKRLIALDLLIARTKPLRERQEKDLKKVRSYKGSDKGAKELLEETTKTLKSAKKERKGIIAKLLKVQDASATK